jgi:hypothetical protein
VYCDEGEGIDNGDKDMMMKIVSLQNFDGSWSPSKELKKILQINAPGKMRRIKCLWVLVEPQLQHIFKTTVLSLEIQLSRREGRIISLLMSNSV